jgi:protein-S-isoprenylcysteine O-methyltransferase Ste14
MRKTSAILGSALFFVVAPFLLAAVIVSVLAIIGGQALLLGDWRLIGFGALLWLAFHLFVVVYEEPTLQGTFGAEYEVFRANVPRWIPRIRPWEAR